MTDLRDVAIVGCAEAEVGWETDFTPAEIMAKATHLALRDAGLRLEDVDAVFAATPYYWMPSLTLAEQLGIQPRYTDSTTTGGSSFIAHLDHAARAILTHGAEVAVIAYASTQRSDGGKLVTGSDTLPFELPYGPIFPVSLYALVAQRHMYELGTTRKQLAEVAVAASRWAHLNPNALKRDLLTVDEVIASPLISDPLRRLDCCLLTNGGAAIVVTSADRAKKLNKPPVHILGTGQSHSHRHGCAMRSYTTTAAVQSGRDAYRRAGLGPTDIDVVQIYDAFTISVIVALEDLGFCKKGEGGGLVERGIGPGDDLAVNTFGGGLRCCHPGMLGMFLLLEAVRQLRHECGDRQVVNARHALVHGIGGVFSGHNTAILGRLDG